MRGASGFVSVRSSAALPAAALICSREGCEGTKVLRVDASRRMLSSGFWVRVVVCHRLPDAKPGLDQSSVYLYTHSKLNMRSREVIRKLEAHGWYEVRQTGSHKQFRHDDRPGLVTVPHTKKELPIGTLKSISRVSGVPLP